MEIRKKWIEMGDADKCQYNGYNDFHKRQSEKMKREELSDAKDKEDSARLKKIKRF